MYPRASNPTALRSEGSLDERLKRGLADQVSTATGKKGTKAKQTFTFWQNAFSAKDWAHLFAKKKSFDSKLTLAVERARSIGLRSLSGDSIRFLVALLCIAHYEAMPSAKQLHSKVKDVTTAFDAQNAADASLPYIVKYPEKTEDFPPELLSSAYAEGDPPQPKTVPGPYILHE